MDGKPILCLDFDGVCHSYTSGWTGADEIRDPPVDGLFEFLLEAQVHFIINVYSSRSHQEGGIPAMKSWFARYFTEWAGLKPTPSLRLTFPEYKPSAYVSLDDRVLTFTGIWPNLKILKNFKPWNKQGD